MTQNQLYYDKKIVHINAWNLLGDRAEANLPVKAVRKLVRSIGNLPIPMDGINNKDLATLLDALADCFDAEMTGDIIGMTTAEGMNIRVFID
ncbi:MAG: hypothetical protein Q4F78_06680 [Bacillota bacterium]|nr:hypothetical protein [Bacillota bacterium]